MKPQGSSGNFEKPPIETTFGRIIGIYDVGTQPALKPGDAPSPTIIWEFELTGQEAKTSKGENFKLAKFMKSSNHSNGTLMKFYLALTGDKLASRPGNNGVWYDLPPDFNARLKALVGTAVMIGMEEVNDKVGVTTLSKPPKGMVVPEATFSTGWLDFDDPENFSNDWKSVPDWAQKKALQAAEMQKPQAPQSAPQKSAPANAGGTFEDDIPY